MTNFRVFPESLIIMLAVCSPMVFSLNEPTKLEFDFEPIYFFLLKLEEVLVISMKNMSKMLVHCLS